MKNQLLLFLFLGVSSCHPNSTDKHTPHQITDSNEDSGFSGQSDGIRVLENTSRLNYSPQTRTYFSDTIYLNTFKFIVYGRFHDVETAPTFDFNAFHATLYTFIDSIKLLDPVVSSLHGKYDVMSGYLSLSKDNRYSFENIIRLNDTNKDGLIDMEVYNDALSGKGSNAIYSVFLNHSTHFEHAAAFSEKTNLEYDKETDTYSSRHSGGHAGQLFTKEYYKYDGKSLIPIKVVTQDFDDGTQLYIRITKDLINNTIRTDSLKGE